MIYKFVSLLLGHRLEMLCIATLVVLVTAGANAQSKAAANDPTEFYKSRVRPILVSQCYTCHTESHMSGLQMNSREALMKGGRSGPAILPGNPDDSLLIRAVSHSHERLQMPPQGKLNSQQIQDLRIWVEAGAHFDIPISKAPVPSSRAGAEWTQQQREFWAFQPIKKPGLPRVQDTAWSRTPIDYFILAKLEEKGLQPARPGDKRTLLRRVTFDLIGLPPTPEEYDAFLGNDSPDAFESVVERLLASPQYGERWGRYWLDVARYAEEDALGLGPDPFPNSFRYRDWVIDAFNHDMPYDVFVKAQIAGDLLEEDSETRLMPGLGLFGLGPWYYKIVDPPKARADELHDRVDVLSRGFLGLTVACARCHDHKYDPISTQDYYAVGGVFTASEYKEYPLADARIVKTYDDHKKKIDDLEQAIEQLFEEEAKSLSFRLAGETSRYLVAVWNQGSAQRETLDQETLERWINYLGSPSGEHPHLQWWEKLDALTPVATVRAEVDRFQAFLRNLIQEQKEIEENNKRVIEESKKSTDPYDLFCVGCNAETKALARDKYMLWTELFEPELETNGQEDKKAGVLYYGEEKIERFLPVERKAQVSEMRKELEVLESTLPERYPFLHVIADQEEPRDMRRHIRGDPYNSGEVVPRRFLSILGNSGPFRNGSGRLELANRIASAENPLTSRVMVNRVWHYHFGQGLVRTLSNFGQVGDRPSHPQLLDYLASRFIESGWSIKQLHREILRSSTYRMSSEFSERNFLEDPENRLLWRANRRRLDVEALRDAMLSVAGELDIKRGGPALKWTEENQRRTVYGKVSRYSLERMLSLFDFPDPTITAEKREITNTPLQRLFFLNSGFIENRSQALAERLEKAAGDDFEARVRAAYQLLFGRHPRPQEVRLAEAFLAEMEGDRPWKHYAQVLLSSNEFSFVD